MAQLHEVSIRVTGLDCASCSLSLPRAIKRIKGVETVTYRQEGIVDIKLASKNQVELTQIRDELKRVGYTPLDAQIRARGRFRKNQKDWFFELEGLDSYYNAVLSVEPGFTGKLLDAEGMVTPKRPNELESFLVRSITPVETEAK